MTDEQHKLSEPITDELQHSGPYTDLASEVAREVGGLIVQRLYESLDKLTDEDLAKFQRNAPAATAEFVMQVIFRIQLRAFGRLLALGIGVPAIHRVLSLLNKRVIAAVKRTDRLMRKMTDDGPTGSLH